MEPSIWPLEDSFWGAPMTGLSSPSFLLSAELLKVPVMAILWEGRQSQTPSVWPCWGHRLQSPVSEGQGAGPGGPHNGRGPRALLSQDSWHRTRSGASWQKDRGGHTQPDETRARGPREASLRPAALPLPTAPEHPTH